MLLGMNRSSLSRPFGPWRHGTGGEQIAVGPNVLALVRGGSVLDARAERGRNDECSRGITQTMGIERDEPSGRPAWHGRGGGLFARGG